MSRASRPTRISKGAFAVPVLSLGVILVVLLLSRRPISEHLSTSSPVDTAIHATVQAPVPSSPIATPLVPTPSPTPIPPLPTGIRIPAIGVDAPMVEVGVSADGKVEEPKGPDEVAWSNGGVVPGSQGNAILSGHFDWSIPFPRGAVFFRLRELRNGDKVIISLENGKELDYAVSSSKVYLAADAPGEEILGPSPDEIITMITCEGTFDRQTRDYSHRRVVVATRIK